LTTRGSRLSGDERARLRARPTGGDRRGAGLVPAGGRRGRQSHHL